MLEVQSDKASVEITSPFDGTVRELLVQEGEIAKVGSALCTIEVDEEVAEELESKGVIDSLEQDKNFKEPVNDVIKVDDLGVKTSEIQPDIQPPTPPRRPHPLDPNRPQPPPSLSSSSSRSEADVLALPSTRHYARSQNVDLTLLIPGSGRGGRIEKSDIDAFLDRKQRGDVNGNESWNGTSSVVQTGEDVVVELGRTRYGMWKAMTKVRFF